MRRVAGDAGLSRVRCCLLPLLTCFNGFYWVAGLGHHLKSMPLDLLTHITNSHSCPITRNGHAVSEIVPFLKCIGPCDVLLCYLLFTPVMWYLVFAMAWQPNSGGVITGHCTLIGITSF
ncbi:hypothetical protein EDB19DRAFT_1164501 [Suillus lakei]|nr:hypothetical protein EDB19DRAFT_1164501 [Suillus lakei]